MRTLKALPAALVLAVFLSCTGVSQTVQSTLKLQVVSGVPVVDGVFVNGQGPYRFLLDTGGQTNQMDESLAHKLGLTGTFVREVETPAGRSEVPGANVAKVALGSAEATGQEFLFNKQGTYHTISPDIRGILGQEFLSRFDYSMDFKRHRLTLGDEAPAGGGHIGFRLVYGCMTVPTNEGDLMLDSGADTMLLFRASPYAASAVTQTSNSAMAVAMVRAPALQIGGRPFHPDNVVYHQMADPPVAGLLPATVFHSIFVSNSGSYVVFDPSEK